MRRIAKGLGGVVFLAIIGIIYFRWEPLLAEVDLAVHGPRSMADRVQEYGKAVDSRLLPAFEQAGVEYPPATVTLVVLKKEKAVELYAGADEKELRFVRSYHILAASGHPGPKLREGDWQVPEGIYGIESLNPNSHYHLALHVGYPNAFDRAKAQADGRTELGRDIMIHGSDVSIGCVAVGDSGAEDLFVLAAKVNPKNVRLLFCPHDFRVAKELPTDSGLPAWTPELYAGLEKALADLPLPPATARP